MPEDIQNMVEVTKKSLNNFTYCFLTEKNLSNFLDIKLFPAEFHNKLYAAGKADYIRVSLLKKYGGIWIDSSTYVNSASLVEFVVSKAIENRPHIIVFDYNHMDEKVNFAFYGAPESSIIMREYKREYDKAFSVGVDKYLKNACNTIGGRLSSNESHLCSPVFLVHMTYSTVLFENHDLNKLVLTLPEGQGHMRLFFECNYQFSCFAKRFLDDPLVKDFPIVKMCSNFRRAVKDELKERSMKKYGFLLLGELVIAVFILIYCYNRED